MSSDSVQQFIPAPAAHRPDCCDFCGLAGSCTKISNRCWPDGGVAENCSVCRRCPDYQNQFIKSPVQVAEAP